MTENGAAPAAPDEDRTPTQESEAPPIKPAEAWVMPEPVFRRSEGYTPQPVDVGEIDPDTPSYIPVTDPEADIAVDDAPPVTGEIEEQPDVGLDTAESSLETPATPAKKGGFTRILLIILGIAGAVIVVGAAVTAFVLWYFFQVGDSQNLN